MNKPLKITLSVIGGLLVFLVGAAIALVLLIDPNDYKDQITALVEDKTGRKLTLAGDLDLSVFPWLGVRSGEAALSNAPGFGDEPFARVQEINVHVKLLPLLRKEIQLDKVRLIGLNLNLARNAEGVTNWADLTKPSEEAPKEPAEATEGEMQLGSLAVGGVDVQDAHVSWDDRQAGSRYDITDFALTTGPIALASPVDFNMSFNATSAAPALRATVALRSQVMADLENEYYSLKGTQLDLRASGDAIPAKELPLKLAADIEADLRRQAAMVNGLKLQVADLTATGKLTGSNIIDAPQFTGDLAIAPFNLRNTLATLAGTPVETADPKAMTQASANLSVTATTTDLDIAKLIAKLDQTTLNGTAAIKNFSEPAIHFNLVLDQMDVDRYLAPKAAREGEKAPPPPAEEGELVPVELLKTLNLDGALKAGKLKISGLQLSELDVGLKARDGLLQVSPLRSKLYGGALAGSAKVDVRGKAPAISAEQRLSAIQINPLLKDLLDNDLLDGRANVNLTLNTRGTDQDQMLRNLGGKSDFRFTDGAIKGINIAQLIRDGYARIKGQAAAEANAANQTDFTEMSGALTIDRGVVKNQNLVAKSPLLRLEGMGTADLSALTLDYLINAAVVGTLKGQGGREVSELKGIKVPVRITGPFADPKIKLELDAALKGRAKQELEQQRKKVEEKVERKVEEKKQELREELQKRLGNDAEQQLKKLLGR